MVIGHRHDHQELTPLVSAGESKMIKSVYYHTIFVAYSGEQMNES